MYTFRRVSPPHFLSTTLALTNAADMLSPPGAQQQGLSLRGSLMDPITHLPHISADKGYVIILQNDQRSTFMLVMRTLATKRLG